MGFLNIVPRNKKYLNYSVGSIPLRVISSDGIDMKPNVDITVSNLNGNAKHFLNRSKKGGTFKIKVLIKRDDVVPNVPSSNNQNKVTSYLDWIIRNMIPVMVVTNAIDVASSGTYIITANNSRKQTYKDSTIWELEFTTYTALNLYRYKNNNSAILKALKKFRKGTSSSSANKSKLAKCNYKKLKYHKKKKVVKCVKYLQKVLKSNKCYSGKVDGWFGKSTTEAVKKFQKKKKLRKTGKVNKKTFKKLCK